MMPVPWAAYCKQRRYGDRSPASYTSIRSTTFAESHPALLTRNALEAISVFDRSPRSRRARRAQKSLSNVQFYTDSLLLMGARFLRSSRCRKATGLSIQLTYRNPIRVSVCPRSRNMSGERSPMQLSPILQEESVTRLLQGAFVGFAATAIIGFTWGGWTLGKTAKEMAEKSAATAVVVALAPICVD